jgi:uncharacterized protein YjbI with pentapeptide repeats
MAEGDSGADVLDRLIGPPSTAQSPGEGAGVSRLDGLDLRPETLWPSVEARGEPPQWWDAARGCVVVLAADFKGHSLRSANLSGASLERVDFTAADLATATLRGTVLGGASFDRALLEEADLEGASLRFATFREAVLEGASLRSADLWGAKLPEADADKADFRDAQLEEADFRDADVRSADFRGAKLGLTDFRGADLRMSDFRDCQPRAAKFDGADLRRARLEQVDLTNASLDRVWLSDARLDRTRFHREQLGGMIGEEAAGEYELAHRGYLSLERNFAEIGDPEGASWAYRRRRRMGKLAARRQAVREFKAGRVFAGIGPFASYLNHKLVELVCDYGESVPRVLATIFAVVAFYAGVYATFAGVAREGAAADGGRQVTRSATDLVAYSATAMIAPGDPPEGLHPAAEWAQVATMTQGYLGIFLIGLLGFVAGNRIRR